MKLRILYIFFVCSIQSILAFQLSDDSVNQNSYKFLVDQFYANEVTDTVKAKQYAKKYLYKAKQDRDTLNMAHGYYFLSRIAADVDVLAYNDTIITITKKKSSRFYPIYAYYGNAMVYYNNGNFKRAFDNLLLMNEEAKKHNNISLEYASKQSIGILKSRIGEHKTALKALRECYDFYTKYKEESPKEYLRMLFALSDSYNLNKVLDSASLINNLGYKESIRLQEKEFQYFFILNEGINQYSKENYGRAKDSLSKSIALMNENGDKANLSMAYFYLGKTLSSIDMEDEAIESHKKVDEIFQEISEIMPDNRENYEILINHYKKINDKDNQLKYIERLIRVDSILHTNYKYLIKNVVQNYDTPRLLSEKQEIIDSLEKEKKSSLLWIISLFIVSIISIIFLGYNFRKRKIYKKRFDELYHTRISNSNNHIDDKKKENINSDTIGVDKTITIGISEEIVKDILDKLIKFEQNFDFLKRNITINSLAKNFDTNSKYLSKIVNTYKKKSFSLYVNELRVDYAIEKLKTDKKFKNYTIRAIAQEIGFNTAEAFSKAFYKKHGIHPSYFIKQLEKEQQD
ncbi:AraC family transcriptional regulator [Aquimarina sp. 2201CG5-10]|uniref:AraC family transcriptional regulator n=1 Tax=Aquimarina callyspongiae TaxID=3098150 RepID=UPI002AB35DBE|nr:AraC family transcriptional regulator [Aquimarina sp. 2201CG5-10]MDY8135148.1 AraC family transcriptional regulator [Aquimarina sp. 2201CG5-10]